MPRLAALVAGLGTLLFVVLPVEAQWMGGLAVGPSAFTITGSDRSDFTLRPAIGARVWLERELRAGLSIGGAVEYLSKGANGTSTVGELFGQGQPNPEREVSLRLNYPYLELPVFLAYAPPVMGRLQPQVYAGAHMSFAQPAYTSYAIAGGPYTEGERDRSVRTHDAGVTAGLLARYETDRFGTLVLGAEVSGGLQNLRATTPALHALGGLLYVGVAF